MIVDDLMLRFTYRAADPRYPVREELLVFSDGRAALWVTAAAEPERRAQSGSYLAQLNAEELAHARALAERLLRLPEDAAHSPARGFQVEENLLVSAGGERRGFNLNYQHGETPHEAVAEALSLRTALLAKLRAAPAAVVGLETRLAEAHGVPELVFVCTGLGTGPVTFVFDPDSLVVQGRGAGGWRVVWQQSGDMGMGLVGKMGVLVDGLYAPADLDPGTMGVLVKVLEMAPAATGDERLWARMEGRIRLVGPGYEESDFPDQSFVIECPLG